MRDSRALTTISNLPVELLQQIFSYCTAFEDPLVGHHAYPAWIAVTHACSRWRAAALNYSSLWTFISTDTMCKRWIKTFMERSNPSFIDLTLEFDHETSRTKHFLNVDEVITLFTGCMRLRSLRVICTTRIVCELLGKLHTATPIRFLSLFVIDTDMRSVVLPDNMLGGQAPIPKVRFFTFGGSIIAPHWLLRGITHFASNQFIPLQNLLDILHQMPALHSFTLKGRVIANVRHPGAAPRDIRVPMPNLMYLTVSVDEGSPTIFAQLLRRLVLPDGARKSVRLHKSLSRNPKIWSPFILKIPSRIRSVIEAANGLRHVQLSGGSLKGSFRLWTGDLGYGEAEFSFEISWRARGTGNGPLCPVIDLAALCDLLGVERVRTLTLRTDSQDRIGSEKSFRQILLRKLPGVEVLK
jgi:hypothetical protein